MKKKNTIISTVLIIIIGIIIAIFTIKASIEKGLEELVDLPIIDVDLAAIDDGIYTGSYNAFPVAAEVKVTIENHRITYIELVEHNHGQGASAEVITEKVTEAQSLNVDIISGATYSSKVILKAIENALKK